MSNNREHVYILGAGFSVPLGGPSFTQLLTTELWHALEKIAIPALCRPAIAALQLSFDGTRTIDISLGRNHRPLDAEEMLAQLDWAERHPNSRVTRLLFQAFNIQGENPEQSLNLINKTLKRVIASQCQSFLNDLDSDDEKLDPYLKWYSELSDRDTIITFNYDTAVEKISRIAGKELPSEPATYKTGQPHLLKLHGSVDWCFSLDSNNPIRYVKDAYTQEDSDLAIGMPGGKKSKLRDITHFETSWQCAQIAISDADIVSIIGYSMPATDNKARMMILKALSQMKKQNVRVNLILGPDSGSVRARRMEAIIQPLIGGTRAVYDLPMFTQDYIAEVEHYMTYPFRR